MRITVTGARGQVGSELMDHLAARGHEVEACTTELGELHTLAPTDAVVHCAAYTDVDGCELDPARAERVNAQGTRNVVAATDAPVIYLSTDYVFDGLKTSPYVESDTPNPLGAYGRSKLAGEQAIDLGRGAVIRTSWVCGRNGRNIVGTVLRLLAEGAPLRFVDDQRGCPTFVGDLVRAVATVVEEGRTGIWHTTNRDAMTWYEFARAVVETAGADPDRVEPIATADLDPPRPAPRPANSVLASQRWAADELLGGFREPLAALVAELRA